MEGKTKSIFRRAAEDGMTMGGYFILLFAAIVADPSSAMLSALALALILGTPFIAYRLLKRNFIASGKALTFSAVWFEGIIMFICGSIFLALGSYIFLRIISPSFLSSQITLLADTYSARGNPSLQEIGATFRKMIDLHFVPRPIEISVSLAWLGAFSGSMLSLVLAGIVKAANAKPKP